MTHCSVRSAISALLLLSAANTLPASAAQADNPAPLPRIMLEDDGASSAIRVLDAAGPLPFPVGVRVAITPADVDAALDARLDVYSKRRVPIWLSLPAPDAVEGVERWRQSLQRLLDRHGAALAILEVTIDRQPADVGAFAARIASTEARARRAAIRVGLGGLKMEDASERDSVYTTELAPYIDVLVMTTRRDGDIEDAHQWLQRVDPEASLIVRGAVAGTDTDASLGVVDTVLGSVGTDVVAHAWQSGDAVSSALRSLTPVAALITDEISTLDQGAVALRLSIGAQDVTGSLRHRLLFNNRTFATYLLYWGDAAGEPLDVSLTLAVAGKPVVHDLVAGALRAVTDYSRDPVTGKVHAGVPLTGRPMVVDFNEGAAQVFVARSDVSAARQLSIGEIIARHQQQQRAQDSLVRNYIAVARMQQHFRPTIADPGYDVVTENRYFVAANDVEWEELTFSVNGSKWTANRPPFPMLQPEKVLSLPLQLRFDEGYRYRLDGAERVDGYDCFVVRFEPVRQDASLYRGTVWIDQKTFARIRVQAVQSGLLAPVVSNEEIQKYAPVTVPGSPPVFLFSGLTARQIVLLAGRNLLVEKNVVFSEFRVNDPGFEQARAAARASDRIMYRETDAGLRYFVKQGDTRVVSSQSTVSAKAMAMGVTIDPSYAFPLPMFGIDYLDFEFGNRNTQLALLFAGVLAAGNIQRPKLGSTPLDASVDFFAIAVPSSDRVYDTGAEREAERVLTWPLSTGLNLGWQYTPFQKATLQYQFRFDAYAHDLTTTQAFQLPASSITNGIGGAWEFLRGGYSFVANGTWFRRSTWKDWGLPGTSEGPFAGLSTERTYTKYQASLSRDFYFKVFHKVHLNGSWFGGDHLDRFAQYQFGLFDDTRIHGVPGSGVRFPELAMARGSYSFNIFDQYRLDLFLEQAWGRDRAFAAAWQPISGFGTAVNLRAPWNTILRVDVGKSLLPPRYRGVGSATLQVLLLKPLR
jgi:hypothetical protein